MTSGCRESDRGVPDRLAAALDLKGSNRTSLLTPWAGAAAGPRVGNRRIPVLTMAPRWLIQRVGSSTDDTRRTSVDGSAEQARPRGYIHNVNRPGVSAR
jgi:hypothetical protein